MTETIVLSTVFFLLGALIFLLGVLIFREAPRQKANLVVSMMLFFAGLGVVLGASGLIAESHFPESEAYGYFVRSFAYVWEFFFPFLLLFTLLYPRANRIISRIRGIEVLVLVPHAFHFVFVLVTSRVGGEFDFSGAAERIRFSRPFLELTSIFLGLVFRWHINLFSFVNLAFAGSSVFLLWKSYMRTKGVTLRQQILAVLLGISACVGLYGVAVLVPEMFGQPVPLRVRSTLMVLSLTLGSAAIAYSVVRYRFLDTRLIARRSVLYGVVSAAFIGAYLTVIRQLDKTLQAFTGTKTVIFETVFAVLALIMFQPVIGRLETYLEEYLMKHRTDYRNVLRRLSKDIVTVLDIDELSRRVMGSLKEALMANCGLLAVVDRSRHSLRLVDSFGIDRAFFETERSAEVLDDVICNPALLSADEALSLFLEEDKRQAMQEFLKHASASWVLPLVHHDEVLGVLTLGEKMLPTRFNSEDRQLLESLGSQLSVALKNSALYQETLSKKLMEEELLFARKIQSAFLPRDFPKMERFDLFGKNTPSRFVGGDYFDFLCVGPNKFVLAIADVAGKGVAAALLTSMLQASLRTQLMEQRSVRQVVVTLNALVADMKSAEQFATFFLGLVDTTEMTLKYCNAGHCYPIITDGEKRPRLLTEGDLVLGVLRDASFTEHTVGLCPGQLVLLYTDGVTEAQAPGGEQYGEERLASLLQALPPGMSAKDVVERVEKSVSSFVGTDELTDDLTLLALRLCDAK
jgi:sigma-B regulation protein RsbU (phosphoserine phosphatase)